MFQAKDFIETAEGLIFAVVAAGLEQEKILCFLRYLRNDGQWRKVDTEQANRYLEQHHPQYLHYSTRIDAHLHAVRADDIVRHYRPRETLSHLLSLASDDAVLADLRNLCGLLRGKCLNLQWFGVTGSLLVGTQNHNSDIDLVCYDREVFHQARRVVQTLIAKDQCQTLNDADWLEAYRRRACDFALDEYIWHEQRKYNKAMINQRKFDLTLVAAPESSARSFRKLGFSHIEAFVTDDRYGFDYPARFSIKHPDIDSVVSFTATYSGQAQSGEWLSAAGQVEVDEHGVRRLVVGSSREAIGEFIKVIR